MDYTCNFLFVGDKIQNMRLYTHLFFASGRWISQEYAERCVKQVNDGDDAKHPASRRSRAHYDTEHPFVNLGYVVMEQPS